MLSLLLHNVRITDWIYTFFEQGNFFALLPTVEWLNNFENMERIYELDKNFIFEMQSRDTEEYFSL